MRTKRLLLVVLSMWSVSTISSTGLEKPKLWVLQPSGRIFFDVGTDDEGEIDLFKDGELAAGIQILSIDLLRYKINDDWETGADVGCGISGSTGGDDSEASVLIWSAGAYFQYRLALRLSAGYMQGISADEALDGSTRDDSALYIGLVLPFDLLGELGVANKSR